MRHHIAACLFRIFVGLFDNPLDSSLNEELGLVSSVMNLYYRKCTVCQKPVYFLIWVLCLIFILLAASVVHADWYDGNWQYRKKITIDYTQVAGTGSYSDFPVLISFTDADLADTLNGGHVEQTDGGDIVFTSSNGISQLKHEIEDYDNVTGKVLAWVKVSSLYTYADTEIYVYYGNAGANDQWDPQNVWTNGYEAVYHLHDDFSDSNNTYNGTNYGSVDYADEKIGNSQDFENETPNTLHMNEQVYPNPFLTCQQA